MTENDENKSDNKTPDEKTSADNIAKTTEVTAGDGTGKSPPEREITTREAYFASLNEWVKRANISQNAMFMFPWYMMNSYPQLFPQQQPNAAFMPVMGLQTPQNVQAAAQQQNPMNANNLNAMLAGVPGFNGFGLRIINSQVQADIINRTGGYEYVVAPFWKRGVAEIIDMIIMLFLKIITIFVVTNIFGYNIMMDMDRDVLNKAMDNEDFAGVLLNFLDILAFSSDYLAFEMATKMFVCLYEAIMTAFFDGATVGKLVMGLSVKYCEAMVPLPPNIAGLAQPPPIGPQIQFGFQTPRIQLRALLFPAETPNFKRAFLRSVAKNVILSLLFPVFFLMIFFKSNRTAYDIMTKTIVVETSSQPPVLRRNQAQQQQ